MRRTTEIGVCYYLRGNEMSKWVPASRKPDSERYVIICPGRRSKVSVGRCDRILSVWYDITDSDNGEHTQLPCAVQWWMPLPKAPKGAPPFDMTEFEAIEVGEIPPVSFAAERGSRDG